MWYSLLCTYKVTTKLPHKLYYVMTAVYYRLKIEIFIIGGVMYPASARLQVDWF